MTAASGAPTSAREGGDRYPCFDGLRALAAIAVVAHHAGVATAATLRHVETPFGTWHVGKYLNHLDVGVQVFFLISGFLLYRPFVAAAFAGRAPVGPRVFFRRRLFRIFPAYWVAFVGIALFVGLQMPIAGARSMIQYFFLVHLYDFGDGGVRALGGISQSWTLVVELSFYAFLPLYAFAVRTVARRREESARMRVEIIGLVLLYLVSLAWRAWVSWGLPEGSGLRLVAQYWLPAHFDLFAMGMGLAVARVWLDRRGAADRDAPILGRLDLLSWALALAAFTLATYAIGLPDTLEVVFGPRAFARQLLYGLTALFLILPAVFGPQRRGAARAALRWAPIAFLGTVSYGIYLWHQAFITKIHEWGGWEPGPGEPALLGFRGSFPVHFLGALALSTVVATASWYLVERPLLRRGGGTAPGVRQDAPAVVP